MSESEMIMEEKIKKINIQYQDMTKVDTGDPIREEKVARIHVNSTPTQLTIVNVINR